MPSSPQDFQVGARVRVTQRVVRPELGGGPMLTTIEGAVLQSAQMKTGSWYAHGKDDKLWLDRLILRKDDGETVYINLDRNSTIEPLQEGSAYA
ncbi:hypothetical protein BH11PLA1_BH11PLA1_21990 [soil metagenome]